MQFTEEQATAIFTSERNLMVTAGAGSGKTRVLVEHFLNLLEVHPDWQLNQLVAITFTEKAALEMRGRIRQGVEQRKRAAQEDPPRRARWEAQEALLDQARISTIHSLCGQILRANPALVPLDPAFVTLDENEAGLLQNQAIELALADLSQGPAGDLLRRYPLESLRQTLREFISRSKSGALAESLKVDWWSVWQATYEQASQAHWEAFLGDEDLQAALAWRPPLPEGDKLSLIFEEVWALAERFAHEGPDGALGLWQAIPPLIRLNVGAPKAWAALGIDLSRAKDVLKSIREACQAYAESALPPLGDWDAQALDLAKLWGQAVGLAADHYTRLKDQSSALDFDDLEYLTLHLLKHEPGLAERYAGREFKQVMVDEFQDTNAAQREIVYALTGLDPQAAQAPQGRLLVVGDPKQSIYAFRGADVSIFQSMLGDILRTGGQEVTLSYSFRSHQDLVAGFNGLFGPLLRPQSRLAPAYEVSLGQPMQADRPSPAPRRPPIAYILCNPGPGLSPAPSAEALRTWQAEEIAQRLLFLQTEGHQIYDRARGEYRPFQFGDAVMLFRSFGQTPIIEKALRRAGIPYRTIGGRNYYQQIEVQDLLNLLRALHNPYDHLALATALRSPLFGFSDEALLRLRSRPGPGQVRPGLWETLYDFDLPWPEGERPALEFAREVLSRLRSLAGRVTVEALLEIILEETAYDALLSSLPDGDRRRENVQKLLARARESGRVVLGDFLRYLQGLSDADPREGEALLKAEGAVQLMTVHNSKGLEFPLVILPFLEWSRGNVNPPNLLLDDRLGPACLLKDEEGNPQGFAYALARQIQAEREAAESKRLLYVAMTRAQDDLWLVGHMKESKEGPKIEKASWLALLEGHYDEFFAHLPALQREVVAPIPPWLLEGRPGPEDQGQVGPSEAGLALWEGLSHLEAPSQALPDMARPIPYRLPGGLRHLSVSILEKMGGAAYYKPPAEGWRAFRHSLLHDSPPPIRSLLRDPQAQGPWRRRILGRMVHRALQVQALRHHQEPGRLRRILEAYAWQEGLSQKDEVDEVVGEALGLLENFQTHGPRPLVEAEAALREVPFVYRLGAYLIHGVMDLVYRYGDQWQVLDYKTADIPAQQADWHAERYAIQMGVYALALQERLGLASPPPAQLYYLHPGHLVTLEPARWRAALAQFEDRLGLALAAED
jgi:ATP-dependent helicase/nuclease subunit A